MRTGIKRTIAVGSTLYGKYTNRKRYPRTSRRFARKVSDCLLHPLILRREQVQAISTVPNKCEWFSLSCGEATDLPLVFRNAHANAFGYSVTDPGISSILDARANFFKVHVISMKNYFHMTNTSNARVSLYAYSVRPRGDIPWARPGPLASLVGHDTSRDLPYFGQPQMSHQDYRFTPYMSPALCHYYKITGVKKIVLEPGMDTNMSVVVNNFYASVEADYYVDAVHDPVYRARKYSRYLIFKIHGQEATDNLIANPTSLFIGDAQLRVRSQFHVEFRNVPDARKIIDYPAITYPTYTHDEQTILNPVTGGEVQYKDLNPTL